MTGFKEVLLIQACESVYLYVHCMIMTSKYQDRSYGTIFFVSCIAAPMRQSVRQIKRLELTLIGTL